VFDKLNFIWIASSAFAAGLLVYPERFLFGRTLNYRKVGALSALAIVVLVCLLAIVNYLDIRLLQEVGIPDVRHRAAEFVYLLLATIQGDGVYRFVVRGHHQAFTEHFYLLLVASLVALGGLIGGVASGNLPRRSLAYLSLVMVFLGIQIFLTKRATGPHHFATFAPFWLIFIAVGLSGIAHTMHITNLVNFTQRYSVVLMRLLLGLIVCVVIASSLRLDLIYFEGFKKPQINAHWDLASSVLLTSALEQQPGLELVVAVDWGMATNIQAISDNRLRVIDLWPNFNSASTANDLAWIGPEFVDRGAAFVVHTQGRETFHATRASFLQAIETHGWPLHQVLTIETADGSPYIEVFMSDKAID